MCTRGTASVAGCFQTSNSHSFFKDGRKIRIGDCALFEPPHDSPPFIGIIRCIFTEKESNLKFTVNWLYRASEVELEKGIQFEAAPNEIFYSFHVDKVPAASLLHPCKVAFLPKGAELPSGVSSFICRRVYDINQKCLWWLTDQNYIDKRQREVNQLLSKTRREMHETVQSGVRSPKRVNDIVPASNGKAGSDCGQNGSSFSSHGKGKKRDRSNQDQEPVKRLQKVGIGDSHQPTSDSIFMTEIAKITDQGGLVNYEAVEKFVQLMIPDKADTKIDLTGRSLLAGVVAATDKCDCLSWFVQLNGLPVFDAWLQEIQKGTIGDVTSHKEGEKSVEDFLLVVLRALDKLPVNLRALQMCNIGKSVNHLRSHKNSEIQRKARSLVDTWKKGVEAEMNIDDGKPVSSTNVAWSGRLTSESSQGGHKKSGSCENGVKSRSGSQYSAPRTVPLKPAEVDTAQTSASTSPGYSKSALSPSVGGVNSKNAQPKATTMGDLSEHLVMTVNDEKSCSSSQSHSQSCSSGHLKNIESAGKEDPRCSTAASVRVGEILRRASRPQKSASGLHGLVSGGVHTASGSNRDPHLYKPVLSRKNSHTGSVVGTDDVPAADENNNKLIVKIPNRGGGHAMKFNDGPVNEQCSSKNRAGSPECLDKHEKPNCGSKVKGDAVQLNDASDVTTKSWHSSDLKDVLTGSDEADDSSAANHDEVHSAKRDNVRKIDESPKDASSSAARDRKAWKTRESSFSPMNALIESCVKHSEANALISAVDVGMNLLASVAASEMSKCDSVATNSPVNSTAADDSENSERSSNMESDAQEQTHGTVKIKTDNDNYEESTSLVANNLEVKPSAYEKLVTNRSESDIPKKQDEKELYVTREIASSQVSMDFATDNQDQKEINEAESELVQRGTSVHSSGGSNHELKSVVSELGGSGVQAKESPSRMHSDAIGPNDAIHTPGAEKCLEPDKDVVELPNDKNFFYNGGSHGEMHQNRLKSESQDNKCQTTETHNTSGGVTSDSGENGRTYKEGIVQNKEIIGHFNGASPTAGKEKLKFDLNEGFVADEVKYEEQKSQAGASCPVAVHVFSPLPFSVSIVPNGLPASVTVAAAVKGAFIPPEDLLKTKGELGWKGSAATSAFRPARPRKVADTASTPHSVALGQHARPFLNIDLNVANDLPQDDVLSQSGTCNLQRNENSTPLYGSGGLNFDLNQIGDVNVGHSSNPMIGKLGVPSLQSKPGNLTSCDSSAWRSFDLNNGPSLEDVGAEASALGHNVWGKLPSHPPVVGLQMNNAEVGNFALQINNAEMGNFASWFPHGNAIPPVTIHSVMPEKGDQGFPIAPTGTTQRVYYTSPGSNPFAHNMYRGPVLSSSPYQYPMFPYGASFPVPSATISGSATYMDSSAGGRHNLTTDHSQNLGHPGVLSSSYPQPYFASVPDGRSNGGLDNSNRWGSLGLDLNSGPTSIDAEGRNDPSPFALRQFSVANSQGFTEEQIRMFQAAGVPLKRKEPDGGWDAEKPMQPSWH